MGQLFGPAKQPLYKARSLARRRKVIIGFGQRMRQALFQQPNPTAAMDKRPDRRRPRMGAELLIGEVDLNGLARAFKFNFEATVW